MMEYEIRFRNDEKPFVWEAGFPDEDTAMFYAEMARERACEKFEEYDPDETYTPADFHIVITGTEDKNLKVRSLNGAVYTGLTKENVLSEFGFFPEKHDYDYQ